jgi:RNA polymerase sigma-70 factor (ECF subfamily)
VRTDIATDVFEEHRPVLMGVAYRMLGRVADAEDVVQEAWLRWSGTDRSAVREPRGYLVRVTTRLAVDRLRQIKASGETYVGPWLPEPYVTRFTDTVPDAAERAVLADSVSLAVLVVLESLSPPERAVFVLREAFGYPHAEIAAMLDRGEAAVRRLAARARRHVEERRPRYEVDPEQRRDLTERFLAAAADGDLEGLMSLLAPDVRLVGDSGGKARAPLRVVESADKVGRFLAGRPARPNPTCPTASWSSTAAPRSWSCPATGPTPSSRWRSPTGASSPSTPSATRTSCAPWPPSSAWSGWLWWCVSFRPGVALRVCDSGRDGFGAW